MMNRQEYSFWMVVAAALCMAILVLLAAPAGALAATCGYSHTPTVSVQVIDPGPRIRSTKSLDQINSMAGSHGLLKQGTRALGITEINLESAVSARFEGQPMLHRGETIMCVRVDRVDVKFGFLKHEVNVPREYPRGSCQFDVVMRHEMAHVDVNRRTVQKYATILKNEVRSVIRRQGAIAAPTMEHGQSVQDGRLRAIIQDVSARFNAELEELHAQIDAPGSRYAATNKCRNW